MSHLIFSLKLCFVFFIRKLNNHPLLAIKRNAGMLFRCTAYIHLLYTVCARYMILQYNSVSTALNDHHVFKTQNILVQMKLQFIYYDWCIRP